MPRLGIFPNLLHFIPQISHNPDVRRHILKTIPKTFFIAFGDLGAKIFFISDIMKE